MTFPHRALVVPDSFKGSVANEQAASALAEGLHEQFELVTPLPLADGGDGSLACLRAAWGGTLRRARVSNALGEPIDSYWLSVDSKTAVVESASATGLALVAGRNDPLLASSRGTGELIMAAHAAGARHLTVLIGGTASTDGGLGAVEALGGSLHGMDVTVACDVRTNFLEAASVFGPQKGGTPAQVQLLTRRLTHLAAEYHSTYGRAVDSLEYAGAGGGLAGGLAALGATLVDGFELVSEATEWEAALADHSVVVTGEGRLDSSSFSGKVVGQVLQRAHAAGVSAVVVCGSASAEGIQGAQALGAEVITLGEEGQAVPVEAMVIEQLRRAGREIGRRYGGNP